MNRNGGPMSPGSSGSNDSGYAPPRYPNHMKVGSNGGFMGAPSDVPYSGGPYGAARPMQSPPGTSSGHPSSSTDASRPSAPSSMGRPASSASSVGTSGRGGMMGHSHRDSTRSNFRPDHEDVLQKHYYSLRNYLAAHLRDEKGNMKPNRARDKLLRLSVTQFMELSTDVYDELIRREDERTHRVPNVPRFLPPKQNFHPKRNQARQKLSTLPVERFRQLATDVFFELERRVPRFGGDNDRPMSSGSRAPSRGGMRPPPGWRGPPGMPYYGPGPNYDRTQSPGPNMYSGARSRHPSDASSVGRPFPKNFNGGTVVPNKSTMVEDDDDEDERLSERYSEMERDKETIKSQETEIDELRKQLEALETKLEEKDGELASARQAGEEHERVRAERGEWFEVREDLERKLSDAQRLNENMQNELEVLKRNKHLDEQDLRRDLETLQHQVASGGGVGSEQQQHRIHTLEEELAKQEELMREVRQETMANLLEMKELSKQNDAVAEQEERLAAQVSTLEREIEEWRERYARVKAQNKSLRASTLGLTLQTGLANGDVLRKDGLISQDGLVHDVDITRFQLAIDDLLKSARQTNSQHMIESVKQVTISVQSITSHIGTDGYPTPSPSPHSPHPPDVSVARLKARVTGTANSLITATKQHATASGLSPVALLDAAASNLTASVIELIKAVGIRPSSGNEVGEADLESFYGERDSEDYGRHLSAPSAQHSDATSQSSANKKTAGWFNWGRASGSDEAASNHRASADDEYDHYS